MIRRSARAYFQVAFSAAGRCRGAERTHAVWNGSRRPDAKVRPAGFAFGGFKWQCCRAGLPRRIAGTPCGSLPGIIFVLIRHIFR